jgi:predicted amidophosphoribosyltransferase
MAMAFLLNTFGSIGLWRRVVNSVRQPVCCSCSSSLALTLPSYYGWLCPACLGLFWPATNSPSVCLNSALPTGIVPLFEWNKAFKQRFYRSKFAGCKRSAQVLQALLLQGMQRALSLYAPLSKAASIVVVPVPARTGRPKRVEELAQQLAWELGWQFKPAALRWQKQTLRQHQLRKRSQRLNNVKGALVLQEALPQNATILVLDDLSTTGATLQEAVRAIKQETTHVCYAFSLGTVPKANPASSFGLTMTEKQRFLTPPFVKMWDGTRPLVPVADRET